MPRLPERPPGDFPHRILLITVGHSPQVVTETFYALAVQHRPRFIPTELHVISTSSGAARARQSLLPGGDDQLGRLSREYKLPTIRFDDSCIHVIRDQAGTPLDDILTPEHNIAVADSVINLVRQLTTDRPDSALHASIAGGRKTMSFLMGYAVSMLGRPQDRMSHVLVRADLEKDPHFFFPSSTVLDRQTQADNGDQPLGDDIILAEIPFVRMRDAASYPVLRSGDISFEALVRETQRALPSPTVIIQPEQRHLMCADCNVQFQPLLLAFYLWFCECRVAGIVVEAAKAEGGVDPSHFLACHRRVIGSAMYGSYAATSRHLTKTRMHGDFIREKSALIKQALVGALGSVANAEPFLIVNTGRRGRPRYQLTLPPSEIRILAIAVEPAANELGFAQQA